MVRRRFDRTVVKKCPYCSQQCPVARKACTCGHQFPTRGRNQSHTEAESQGQESSEGEVKRRRTVRTKRMRPDFFNPQDEDYTTRKLKRNHDGEMGKRKRGRPKGSINKVKPDADRNKDKDARQQLEEDVYANITPERAVQYTIILAELNRKFGVQNFQPS